MKAYQKQIALSALFLLVLMFLLAGCNSNGNLDNQINNSDYIPKADEYYEDNPVSEHDAEAGQIFEVQSLYKFSEGLAWIQYQVSNTAESKTYYGCINKEGKVLFAYPESSIYKKSEFIDGAAYIMGKGSDGKETYWIINEDGDILTSSVDSDFDSILVYGGGYFLCYKDQSDFSGANNCYKVIDSTGNIVKEIIYKKEEFTHAEVVSNNLRYLGDGIFSFWKSDGKHSREADFYNIPDNIEFTYGNISSNHRLYVEFNDGIAFLKRIDLPDMILHTDGTYTELRYVEKGNYFPYQCYASEGKVVLGSFYMNSGGLDGCLDIQYYSIDDDAYYPLDAFIDNMYLYDSFKDYCAIPFSGAFDYRIVDDRFLAHLLGADMLPYIALINTNNEVILEPVRCDRATTISCGRIAVRTDDNYTIYDTDGNVVYAVSDVSFDGYQDDSAVLGDKYVDLQGNDLFGEYDFSSVVEKELP